eukprot:TRINITY_DN7019_c0_g1_i1.p1 TRINITY_DN7019_c0_g1~~TRINITY_DN7019_c0_g1_i1.p1  ORF type:complete len:353 (+),score=61.87 TRINITY_DN7019_c0_g1_i1:152-1210(+)
MLFSMGASTAVLYGAMLLDYAGCSQVGPTHLSLPLNWKGQLMEASQAPNETSQASAFNAPSETSQAAAVKGSVASDSFSGDGVAGASSEGAPGFSVVVSSWIVMTLTGGDPAPDKEKKRLDGLAEGIRTALSEALGVCRASVHVTDMSTKDTDSSFLEVLEAHRNPRWRQHTLGDRRFQHRERVWDGHNLAKLAALMRRASHDDLDDFTQLNFTHLKASYEVRIFPDMRVPVKELTSRIDRLQMFSRFADLNHVLVRNIVHGQSETLAEAVMLDDVGYALRETKARSPLSASQMADCIEDGLLQDAREVHQYIIAFCCILVLLITCAGSAIFSLKQPSLVPSRTNPLLARTR